MLAIGTGVAAAQDGAEPVFLDLFGCDRTIVGLNDLADFLLEGHFGHEIVDARLDGGIDEVALNSWPQIYVAFRRGLGLGFRSGLLCLGAFEICGCRRIAGRQQQG